MAFHEFACVAVCRTEEKHIYFVQRKFIGEHKVGLSIQSFVDISYFISGITRTIDKPDFYIGVVNQQTNQFACRITGSSYYSYFNHGRQLFVFGDDYP